MEERREEKWMKKEGRCFSDKKKNKSDRGVMKKTERWLEDEKDDCRESNLI